MDVPFENTLLETLGIRALETNEDRVVLEMNVGPRVHQPMRLLHGGASAAMAESAASIGAYLNCSPEQYALGVDLNITHLQGQRAGIVRAIAEPIRKGRTVHVWAISIVNDEGEPVAVARCTLAIRSWNNQSA
jgi:1,4-dihydroxy-2-naphthoyl-CoA hydrolase